MSLDQKIQEMSLESCPGSPESRDPDESINIPEGPDLLGSLYRELLEADNFMGPLIRYFLTVLVL